MSLFTRLGEKSWETPGSDRPDPATYRPPAAQVMMLVYFGVITILFGLVSSAYFMRMGMPGMGHAAMDWRPMPEPPLIWNNTAVLLLASLAWEAARIGTRRGETALVRPGLRSEEHTSELQSLMRISYAVFCLKKKHTDDIWPYR